MEGDAGLLLGQEPQDVPVLLHPVNGAQGGKGANGKDFITFSQPHLITFLACPASRRMNN